MVYKKMFSMGKKEGGIEIGKLLTPYMYFSVFFCLLISLFSEEIIFILTPYEFHSASKIISVLCMLYAIYFFGKQPQLLYSKKTLISTFIFIFSIFGQSNHLF